MRANIIRYFSCKINQFMSMHQLQFCQASEWQVRTHNLRTHFPQSTCPSCHHSSLYYKSSKTPLCSQEGLTNQQSALLCRPLRESHASKNACSLTEECLIIFLSGLGLGTESKDYNAQPWQTKAGISQGRALQRGPHNPINQKAQEWNQEGHLCLRNLHPPLQCSCPFSTK